MTTTATPVTSPGTVPTAAQVREFVEAHLPDEWRRTLDAGDAAALERLRLDPEHGRAWYEVLGRAGLATPTWPAEYHGLGLTPADAAGIRAALADLGVGRPAADEVGIDMGGPTVLEWGTDEQKARWLPPLARGAQRWCQLFSEPGAGSDLASLATRAVPQPDGGWLVTGQKVWNSYAHIADLGMLLARTDPGRPKHHGISFFVVDMHAPGVEVRPLRQITGDSEFNEVFLTDVRLPPDALLGPLHAGWRVAISTLMSERSSISGRPSIGPGRATRLVRRALATGAWQDPLLRDRLVQLFVEERALQTTTIRASVELAHQLPGAEGSVRKLRNAELDETAGLLAADIDPDAVTAWDPSGPRPSAVDDFLQMKKISIAGGTSEIQRTIIGERMLGLPKDPDPDRDLPFDARTVR
ncbi:acyl-CoA dehydrogenase [Nakamurella sp. YIM 132087]|uniref:Acyl-CoA dehydrogenase n=1 Tax=Nakamurella alba TaxID=2665158 RepID=A0A7K1FPE6_9ACTN|nr:acyl-CoA dehydrogenase family protein [Nakamurella alba]MTD15960.1 acyl-CoA dehydrogenase [Nakamurella alba]